MCLRHACAFGFRHEIPAQGVRGPASGQARTDIPRRMRKLRLPARGIQWGNGSCPPARFVPADRGGQPTRQLAEGSVKPVHETRLPRTRSTLLAGETAMERKLLRGNRRRCPARHVETIHRKPEPTSMTKVKAFHHRPKGRRPHARKR